jgi:hypothetical protein
MDRSLFIRSCYLLSINYRITPEVYFSFRRSHEKAYAPTIRFQRAVGTVAEEGENKDTLSRVQCIWLRASLGLASHDVAIAIGWNVS